jgi:protein translocase SecG subunit
MQEAVLIASVILSILIVTLILLQNKGSGLGSAWGGGGGGGEAFQTRRGLEKVTLNATIVCIVIFFILSFAKLLIN